MQTLPQPVKVTMTGPMFRYDRPQAGRYRQFWQFDVEAIGDPGPAVDAELIELASRFYTDAGSGTSGARSTRSATPPAARHTSRN
jgi:histidyl-tRNA synthetase